MHRERINMGCRESSTMHRERKSVWFTKRFHPSSKPGKEAKKENEQTSSGSKTTLEVTTRLCVALSLSSLPKSIYGTTVQDTSSWFVEYNSQMVRIALFYDLWIAFPSFSPPKYNHMQNAPALFVVAFVILFLFDLVVLVWERNKGEALCVVPCVWVSLELLLM